MRRRPGPLRSALLSIGVCATLACAGGEAGAATPAPIALGAADSFAVLGATTVTSAGQSTLTGDLGVSPGTAMTGFAAGDVSGTMHAGDATAAQAHADTASAYDVAVARSPASPAGVLDGLTLGPGTYASGAALSLAGALTLDAGGDPDAVFILQAGSTLTTAAASHVELAGGAQACNVFWQVGSSATLGAASQLTGTILASTSISMGDGVTINGRALARDGAVTMIHDSVSVPRCAGALSNTAPTIEPFSTNLTGRTHTVHSALGAWSVTDTRGSAAGYTITASVTAPTVNGTVAGAGTGAGLALTLTAPEPAPGNPATTGPTVTDTVELGPTAATIATADANAGQGQWDFPADQAAAGSLAVTIPGDASAGSFHSTLTFTVSPSAG